MQLLPPVTRPDWAADFFDTWFDGRADTVCVLSQLLPGLKKAARHRFGSAANLAHGLRGAVEEPLDQLVYEDGMQWNLYMGVGTLLEVPPGGRKGGKKDVKEVPGVWVDLDTNKEGFFRDEVHCLQFLRGLELLPSIVVATGTGGVHAYWKTAAWLSGPEAERLDEAWWAYLSEQAGGAKIDRLTNCDRLMKLPGSVRWPRDLEGATLVRLLYADGSVRREAGALDALAAPAFGRYQASVERHRERVAAGRMRAHLDVQELAGKWDLLLAMQDIEERFNDRYTWRDILVPLGWTEIGSDSEDRTIWARPGLAPEELHKSAATDYGDSQAMSLFSDSAETGLQDLAEAGVPLTKYRVFVECVWGGDEPAFVRAYLAEQMEENR